MRIFFSRWLELYALFRGTELPSVHQSAVTGTSAYSANQHVSTAGHHLAENEHQVEKALELLEETSDANIEECLPQLGNLVVNMKNQPQLKGRNEVNTVVKLKPKFSFFKRTMTRGSYGASEYYNSVSVVSVNRPTSSPDSVYDYASHCLTFMRQGLEAALIRKCTENPVIAIKFAWILEDMGTNSISMSERCNVLADICRHAGTRSLSSDILSQQVYNAVTFLEQLVSISREICHLKFSKTTAVKAELLSIVSKSRIEWLNRNLLLNMAIMGKLVPPLSSVGNLNFGNSTGYSSTSVNTQLDQLEDLLTSHVDIIRQHALPLLVVPCHYKALKVLRLVEEETLILNSASRSPLMVTLEVLESEEDTLSCLKGTQVQSSNMTNVTNVTNINDDDKKATSYPLNGVNPSWLEELVSSSMQHGAASTLSQQEQAAVQVLWRGWGEIWTEKVKRIKARSKYGALKGWHLCSFVVKEGDDLKREKLAMQFIELFQKIWQQHHIGVYVRPYAVMCCGSQCGLIENVVSARSLDSLKKNTGCQDLPHLFTTMFGVSEGLEVARENFMRSLAAYSVISYVLQVKDRHNGNILLDTSGHLIHIDYGFILGDSPGRNLGWERAPFKLTKEYCDVIGQGGSQAWFEFEHMIVDAFVALQAHVDSILQLATISLSDYEEGESSSEIIELLKLRIMTPPFEVRSLIAESVDNFFTKSYDMLQRQQNGIL